MILFQRVLVSASQINFGGKTNQIFFSSKDQYTCLKPNGYTKKKPKKKIVDI